MPAGVTNPVHAPVSEAVRRVNVPFGTRYASSSTYDPVARTVEIVAATETPVRMPGWHVGLDCEFYYEILDCRAEAVDISEVETGNCPLLDAHGRYSMRDRLGRVRGVRFESGQVIALGALGQSEAAKAIEPDIASDDPPKVSSGYRREQMMLERFEGDVPVYRVTKWTLKEVSFVPIAADPNAGVRSEAHVFPCSILETQHMPEVNPGVAVTPTPSPTPAVTPAPVASPAPAPEAPAAAVTADGSRADQQRFTASAALTFVDGARAFGETVVTRANDLIAQNERGEISVETARGQLMTSMAEAQRAQTGTVTPGGGNIQITDDSRDKWLRGATNALIQRAGLADMVRSAARLRGEEVDLDPGEFRGIRNVELARMSLENAGVRIDTYDRDRIVGLALTHRSASGPFQSSSDFAVLLENVMHKTLQAAYATAPDTWRRFCGVGSVTDFRPHPRILRGTFGALDTLTEDGEFKNKAIPDGAKESISAKTKGNIVGLTRQAIVNDDLGAFNSITVELARAAKLSIEKDVYALLALNSAAGPTMNDSNPLFHADHKNIASVAAAPSVTAFDAIRVQMASQMDLSGNEFLDIVPSIWLGPIGLGGAARVTNGAEYDPDTANKLQRPNIVKGMFRDIVDTPRMTGTRWYAFADPSIAPAIEVVFLDGNQEPYTEMKEGWRIDGTEWKVRLDYGVGALNWRSTATNAGA